MIGAGFAGLLAIANEKTDHLWIVLTGESTNSLAVLVMLTDVNNIENPTLVLDPAKPLTDQFTLTKRSTIDFARSHTTEEIKAVTYHQLRVEPLPDGTWRATVIFDV